MTADRGKMHEAVDAGRAVILLGVDIEHGGTAIKEDEDGNVTLTCRVLKAAADTFVCENRLRRTEDSQSNDESAMVVERSPSARLDRQTRLDAIATIRNRHSPGVSVSWIEAASVLEGLLFPPSESDTNLIGAPSARDREAYLTEGEEALSRAVDKHLAEVRGAGVTGASEKAWEAAHRVLTRPGTVGPSGAAITRALKAAHDPALGLDRNVRLGDVVGAVRHMSPAGLADLVSEQAEEVCVEELPGLFATFIEREFGGGS